MYAILLILSLSSIQSLGRPTNFSSPVHRFQPYERTRFSKTYTRHSPGSFIFDRRINQTRIPEGPLYHKENRIDAWKRQPHHKRNQTGSKEMPVNRGKPGDARNNHRVNPTVTPPVLNRTFDINNPLYWPVIRQPKEQNFGNIDHNKMTHNLGDPMMDYYNQRVYDYAKKPVKEVINFQTNYFDSPKYYGKSEKYHNQQIDSADHQIGSADHQIGSADHQIGSADHQISNIGEQIN